MADNIRLQLKNSDAPDDWKDAGENSDSPVLPVRVLSGGGSDVFTSSVPTEVTLTDADTAYKLPASELDGRKVISIYNISDTDIYIGDASVTTSNGMLVMAGNYMRETIGSGLYACCAEAGKKVRILEFK